MQLAFAQPKHPFHRSPEYGYAPKSLDHVRPGGWVECVVGSEYIYDDGEPRNVIFAIVLGFSSAGRIFAIVNDEVQDPSITGVRNQDLLELELADITKSEHSPAQQELEFACQMMEVEREILAKHEEEFDRRYPDCSRGVLLAKLPLHGEAWRNWLDHWSRARREFVAELVRDGRA